MNPWPSLPLASWRDTYETLHRWAQIPGKIKLARTPLVNHWWNIAFLVTPRGLSTGSIPDGSRSFEMAFDFVEHRLVITTSSRERREIALAPRSVAHFYADVVATLASLDISVPIWTMPVEIPDPVRFEEDEAHASYDHRAVENFHGILLSTDRAFQKFRAEFVGKSSPVHFFWGSFDMCVTRFSGRAAPVRENADAVTREAYSHEVSSVGFWPGGPGCEEPVFYSYAAPEPAGFKERSVTPAAARYDMTLGEFLLPYDAIRTATDPEEDLLSFCRSSYGAAAENGRWDRPALERTPALR